MPSSAPSGRASSLSRPLPRLSVEELRAAAIDYTPRPRGKNALRVSCGCRSIRVFPSSLVMGDIVCRACGSVFE